MLDLTAGHGCTRRQIIQIRRHGLRVVLTLENNFNVDGGVRPTGSLIQEDCVVGGELQPKSWQRVLEFFQLNALLSLGDGSTLTDRNTGFVDCVGGPTRRFVFDVIIGPIHQVGLYIPAFHPHKRRRGGGNLRPCHQCIGVAVQPN